MEILRNINGQITKDQRMSITKWSMSIDSINKSFLIKTTYHEISALINMKTFSIDVRLIFLDQISSRMKHPWKTNIIESSSSHTQVQTAANVFRCLLHRMISVQIQNIVLGNIEMMIFSKLKFALFEVVSSFPFQASLDFLLSSFWTT